MRGYAVAPPTAIAGRARLVTNRRRRRAIAWTRRRARPASVRRGMPRRAAALARRPRDPALRLRARVAAERPARVEDRRAEAARTRIAGAAVGSVTTRVAP